MLHVDIALDVEKRFALKTQNKVIDIVVNRFR